MHRLYPCRRVRQAAGCSCDAGSAGLCNERPVCRDHGSSCPGRGGGGEINHLITLNLFTTITNANFDKEAIEARIRDTLAVKEKLLAQVEHKEQLPLAALWDGTGSWEAKAAQVGVLSTENEDIRSCGNSSPTA